MEPKLKDIMVELQKINRRLDKIEKQLETVSKRTSGFEKTTSLPLVTTAPLDFGEPITITRFLDGSFPQPITMPEDHFCEKTVDHKHILPPMWAGPGPIPCQLCGKNTGGIIR